MASSPASSPLRPSPQTTPNSPPPPSTIDWASINTLLQEQPHSHNLSPAPTPIPNPAPTCPLTQPHKTPKYPQHTCFHGADCCVKFSGEGPLYARNFNHLPVCHNACWTRERNRLEKEARDASSGGMGEWEDVLRRVPVCHRECYMRGLRRVQGAPNAEREVVPLNRCLGEVLRVPRLQHWYLSWVEGRSGGGTDEGGERMENPVGGPGDVAHGPDPSRRR